MRAHFDRGVLTGTLLMLGASAVHWLITPMRHPDASTLEHAWAIAQALGAFGTAGWLLRFQRPPQQVAA